MQLLTQCSVESLFACFARPHQIDRCGVLVTVRERSLYEASATCVTCMNAICMMPCKEHERVHRSFTEDVRCGTCRSGSY
jgi:hypothetical protein